MRATARPSPTSSPIWRCRPRATATNSESAGTVARRLTELWEEGRVDAVLSLMAPDLEWLEPPETPDRAVVTGREQALSALMMWLSTWASYENELIDVTEHGDQAIVEFRHRMVGPGSGLEVQGELFMVWTVRDGLATRMAMYTSREQALADLG